jgi:hypothetical protein
LPPSLRPIHLLLGLIHADLARLATQLQTHFV